jgi:hypothetical protein
MLTLKQVDETMREVFNDKLVKSVDTVYEKNGKFYKLVFSIHGIELDDTIIIHTKFIFPTNKDKTGLINNKFSYLKNLGCGYDYVEFEEDSLDDLKETLLEILNSNNFDEELRDLSDFLSNGPDSRINNYLYTREVESISVHEVRYDPRFKMRPCDESTFDFDLNINNSYDVHVSIKRNEPKKEESTFDVTFKMKEVKTITVESIQNIGEIIGQQLIEIFEKRTD